MKRLMVVFGVSALLPGFVRAQEPQQAVTLDVLLPALAVVSRASGEMAWIPFNVKYQRVVDDHLVLSGKAGVNYSWATGEQILELYPVLAAEWHPFETGLNGFNLGPALLISYTNYWNDYALVDNPDHTYRIAPGVNLGWQFALESKAVIDVTVGAGYGYEVEVDRQGKAAGSASLGMNVAGIFLGYGF